MNRNRFEDIPNEIDIRKDEFPDTQQYAGLIIDIGCGNGDYLVDQVPKNPDKLFIGIEIVRKKTYYTSSRLQKRNLNNYLVVHEDAENVFDLWVDENSVDEIHINFPTPWLHQKEWKTRVLRPSLLIQIHKALKADGKIFFVTDVYDYALYASEIFMKYPHLFVSSYQPMIQQNLYQSFPTLFYRRMSEFRDINYLLFQKTQTNNAGKEKNKTLVVSTKNKNKLREIQVIFKGIYQNILSSEETGYHDDIEETGETFFENAQIKAKALTSYVENADILADDSGLEVDALGGRPGIYSARYAGPDATQEMLINKLLNELKDVPEEKRGARFICSMVLIQSDGTVKDHEGYCEGRIAEEASGDHGFGYDPVFLPYEFRYKKTMAELEPQEKNQISHRYLALIGLREKML